MKYLKTFESYEANKDLTQKILEYIEKYFDVKETEINITEPKKVKYIVVDDKPIYLNGDLKKIGDARVKIKYDILENLLDKWRGEYSEQEVKSSTDLAIKEFIKKNQ